MNKPDIGCREIEHTADWELEVWAPNLSALFEQAARGMYMLAGTRLQTSPRLKRELQLRMSDTESLLVSFLTELLYFGEQDGVGFDEYQLTLQEYELKAVLWGAPIAQQNKEIKAVTYHKLAIRQTPRGQEVNIVFDV